METAAIHPLPITAVYAALLGLVFLALSVRTLRMRRRLRVAVGDAGHEALLRAMRVHANFAEYVPLSLLLVYFLETSGRTTLVHAFCIVLLGGRLVHAYGVSRMPENYRYRVAGMAMTFVALAGSALAILLMRIARGVAG